MKVFVTGASGQLGSDVVSECRKRGFDVLGTGSRELDITDAAAVMQSLCAFAPDAVVHCAAWTAVDAAEDNVRACQNVNAAGTENVAKACKACGAKMVYISTDYVFNGSGTGPWQADCTDFGPLNVYGRSKLDGELAVKSVLEKYFIVRISWVFGPYGKNFVRTMLKLGKTHPELRVVNDQVGTPTYTPDLAVLLADMLQTEEYGVYHATNEGGFVSWYDFACEIFRQAGYDTKIVPVSTEEYGQAKALRPKNSRLDKSKLTEHGFKPLPDWRNALSRFLEAFSES